MGCRRQLVRLQFDAQTFSDNGSFFPHRIDICQQVELDIILVLDRFLQNLDCLLILLLNSDDNLCCVGNFLRILRTLQNLGRILFDLLNVMSQSRFALRCIHQFISVCVALCSEVDVQLVACRETGTAHSDDTRFLNHLQRCVLGDHFILFRLFLVRLDDDAVFLHFFNRTIYAGMKIRTGEACRLRNLGTLLHLISCLDNRCALHQKHLNVFHSIVSP